MEPMVRSGRVVRLKAITFVVSLSVALVTLAIIAYVDPTSLALVVSLSVVLVIIALIAYLDPARFSAKAPGGWEINYEAKTTSTPIEHKETDP